MLQKYRPGYLLISEYFMICDLRCCPRNRWGWGFYRRGSFCLSSIDHSFPRMRFRSRRIDRIFSLLMDSRSVSLCPPTPALRFRLCRLLHRPSWRIAIIDKVRICRNCFWGEHFSFFQLCFPEAKRGIRLISSNSRWRYSCGVHRVHSRDQW